jgi:hypothetical protein
MAEEMHESESPTESNVLLCRRYVKGEKVETPLFIVLLNIYDKVINANATHPQMLLNECPMYDIFIVK